MYINISNKFKHFWKQIFAKTLFSNFRDYFSAFRARVSCILKLSFGKYFYLYTQKKSVIWILCSKYLENYYAETERKSMYVYLRDSQYLINGSVVQVKPDMTSFDPYYMCSRKVLLVKWLGIFSLPTFFVNGNIRC